jgi:cellulose synthase/poly-beta-1,6-N-acetylglucosamine synthase-like glycosyltransferase
MVADNGYSTTDLFNRRRFLVASLFTVFLFVIVTLMILNLIFGSSSTLLSFAKAIPLVVIIVDGGDRVFRFFIDMRRQARLQKIEKREGEIPRGLKPYMKLSYRTRPSDTIKEFDLKPYRVVAAIYRIEDEWDEILENLAPFKDKLFLVDDHSPDNTFEVVKESGVEIIRNPVNTNKPGAVYYGIQNLPEDIETVLVIDPDVVLSDRESVERAVYDLQLSGAGACAVNILPIRPKLGKGRGIAMCQAIEYEFSMYCGREVPHNYVIISGACGIFNRGALQKALSESSRSVYAEDLETTLMIISDGWRTYYDTRVLVRTEVPYTLKRYTLQRIGWSFGLARATFVSMWKVRKCKDSFFRYQFYVYNLGITLLFHPFRVAAVFILALSIFAFIFGPLSPAIARYQWLSMYEMLFIVGFYMFFAVEGYFGSLTLKRSDWPTIFLYPFYTFYQMLLPITLGYLNYITWTVAGRKIIKDPFGPKVRERSD